MYLGGLCFVTDVDVCQLTCCEMTHLALRGGAMWVQYRAKDRCLRDIYHQAIKLRELTTMFDAKLIINDHADIALAVDADGVHLGQKDLPLNEARKILGAKKIIGISTHNVEEAIEAERGGADYIGFGSIFRTVTKDTGEPVGLAALSEVKRNVRIPVTAIGGIDIKNLEKVISAGADAVAAASGLLKDNVEASVKSFMQLLQTRG